MPRKACISGYQNPMVTHARFRVFVWVHFGVGFGAGCRGRLGFWVSKNGPSLEFTGVPQKPSKPGLGLLTVHEDADRCCSVAAAERGASYAPRAQMLALHLRRARGARVAKAADVCGFRL